MIGVFGANGFIGRHVTRHLVDNGLQVTAVARTFDEGISASGARVVTGDLRDASAMSLALEGVDTVIQLMGTSTPAQGNARTTEHIETDVIPHVDFLNQCVTAGVRRFIFASSGGTVYGPVSHTQPTPESAATNPISSHGVSKLTVEHFIKLHGHLDGLEYFIFRIANPYGPGQVFKRGQGLIPALLERHHRGLPITVYGDGTAARDYVYIDDVARAIHTAVQTEGQHSLVLNVGSGIRRSILEVIQTIERIGNLSLNVQFAPARNSDVSSIALDVDLIGEALDWKPEIDFQEGIRRTLRSPAGLSRGN